MKLQLKQHCNFEQQKYLNIRCYYNFREYDANVLTFKQQNDARKNANISSVYKVRIVTTGTVSVNHLSKQ